MKNNLFSSKLKVVFFIILVVSLKLSAVTIQNISQNAAIGGSKINQTFTANYDGKLESITFRLKDNINKDTTISVYRGVGTSGTRLYTKNLGSSLAEGRDIKVTTSSISLTKDSVYTFGFTDDKLLDNNNFYYYKSSDKYSGGDLYSGSSKKTGQDLYFKVVFNANPTDISLSTYRIDENLSIGTTVATITAVDPDSSSVSVSLGCSRSGADDDSFTIDGTTLKTASLIDYNTQSTYNICIRARDSKGLTFDKNLKLYVTKRVAPEDSEYTYTIETYEYEEGIDYRWSVTDETTLSNWLKFDAGVMKRYVIAGTGSSSAVTSVNGVATEQNIGMTSKVVVANDGNIYISSRDNGVVYKVDTSGNMSFYAGTLGVEGSSGDGGAATSAQLDTASNIAVDSKNNLYIADFKNYAIRKVDKQTGIIDTVVGKIGERNFMESSNGDGGAATAVGISNPGAIAFDSQDNLYFWDGSNNVLRKVDTQGILSTIAGSWGHGGYSGDGGLASEAQLRNISSIAFDSSDNIYIASSNDNVVRKIDMQSNIITTVAGTGTSGVSGDNGLATSAQLDAPYSIVFDKFDNLYIGDGSNYAVRKVDVQTK